MKQRSDWTHKELQILTEKYNTIHIDKLRNILSRARADKYKRNRKSIYTTVYNMKRRGIKFHTYNHNKNTSVNIEGTTENAMRKRMIQTQIENGFKVRGLEETC
jgi:hypothetical protein